MPPVLRPAAGVRAVMLLVASLLQGTLLLSACASQLQDCARPDVFCVGLVTDLGTVHSGIEREAWLGLQDAQAAHLVDRIDVIETADARDRAANIQTLAEDGYDVIVTVGASMGDATTAAAAKYPKLSFIGVEQPQSVPLPNLAGLVFHEERSGFLAGALAALMTQTGRVAAVCEPDFIDAMRRYCDGFEAGARYASPGIASTATYRQGSPDNLFNDPDWGSQTALEQVQAGADVVFAAGGQTGAGALQAAASQGIYVIGSETDQYLDLPDVRPQLLTSATSDIRSGVVELLTRARHGELPSGNFFGAIKLAPWHDLDRRVPAEVKQRLELIGLALEVGTLEPGVPYELP